MKRLKRDEAAASEIVGALLLTLIVVAAAASFSVFVSQRQKEIQAQQLLDLRRDQESVHFLGLQPTLHGSGDRWDGFNITVSSAHNENTRITRMAMNGNVVKEYVLWRLNVDTGNYESAARQYSDELKLFAGERISIQIDVDSSFFVVPTFMSYETVNIEANTEFQNVFSRIFIPPMAMVRVITETQWNAATTSYEPYIILDGSGSSAPGGGYLVSWSWHITGDNNGNGNFGEVGEEDYTLNGQKAVANFPTAAISYKIQLNVVDNFGMVGIEWITFDY